MTKVTAIVPNDPFGDVFTPDAAAKLVGQRPVLRDLDGGVIGRAPVTAAEVADGELRITVALPETAAQALARESAASIGYMTLTAERNDELALIHEARLFTIDPRPARSYRFPNGERQGSDEKGSGS